MTNEHDGRPPSCHLYLYPLASQRKNTSASIAWLFESTDYCLLQCECQASGDATGNLGATRLGYHESITPLGKRPMHAIYIDPVDMSTKPVVFTKCKSDDQSVLTPGASRSFFMNRLI